MDGEAKSAECILVADSEVLVRHGIADYLRDCGYMVIEAASSDEAEIVLCQTDVPVAAILCDAKLGGSRNAFELRGLAAELRPGLEVVLAGNVEAAAKAASQICEEGPHLSRPYDPSRVVGYIRRLLAKARG